MGGEKAEPVMLTNVGGLSKVFVRVFASTQSNQTETYKKISAADSQSISSETHLGPSAVCVVL